MKSCQDLKEEIKKIQNMTHNNNNNINNNNNNNNNSNQGRRRNQGFENNNSNNNNNNVNLLQNNSSKGMSSSSGGSGGSGSGNTPLRIQNTFASFTESDSDLSRARIDSGVSSSTHTNKFHNPVISGTMSNSNNRVNTNYVKLLLFLCVLVFLFVCVA